MPLYGVKQLNKFPPENILDKASKLLYANGNFFILYILRFSRQKSMK